MKKSILSVMFLTGLFVFANAPFNTVLAQEKIGGAGNKIEIKDVKITLQNDRLEISAVLFNPSQNVKTPPFIYLLTLSSINQLFKFGKFTITPPSILVSALEGSDYVSLKPQEQKTVNFFLSISPRLPKNNYTLNIAMILTNGEALDHYQDVIYDLGSNQKIGDSYKSGFLAFDQLSCVIITTDGREFGNNDGPIFKPLETPKIRCTVKNIGQEEITVFPNIEWKELFVYGRLASGKKAVEKSDKAITFKSGEIKTIELSLPSVERPQVYQALLSFIDKNNIIRSYNMPFRWTIGGPSARVEKVVLASPLKSVYEKGETISLSVDYFGSMDLFWGGISEDKVSALTEVKTLAVIKDKKGAVCGQKEATLPDVYGAGLQNKIIDIALDKKCEGVSYNVSLLSEGENLAELSGFLPNMIIENQAEEKSRAIPLSYYIIGAFILIAAYKIVIAINRKRHKNDWQKNLMILLIIGAAVVFFINVNSVEAAGTLTVSNVSYDGLGSGNLRSDAPVIGAINCDTGNTGDCSETYTGGSPNVTVIATPSPGSVVSEWRGNAASGSCIQGSNTCVTRAMNQNRSLTARFVRAYPLIIESGMSSDDGNGTITESGINCSISAGVAVGPDCSESYASGASVKISANHMGATDVAPANDQSIFAGWVAGDCAAAGNDCELTMTGNRVAKAVFRLLDSLATSYTSIINSYEGSSNSFTSGTSPLYVAVSKTGVNFQGNFSVPQAIVNFTGSNAVADVDFTLNTSVSGCFNTQNLYKGIRMTVGADSIAEQPINFRRPGGAYAEAEYTDILTDYYQKYLVNPSRGSILTLTYEIDPSDPDWASSIGGTNPYLILYITQAARPYTMSAPVYYRRGSFTFSYTNPYIFNIDLNKFDIGSSGPTSAVFTASDVIKIKIPLVIPPSNNPPVLNSIGNRTINENQLLTINVSATDADLGDTLIYSASPLPLPSGASFVGQTFSWTPTFSQAGTYSVRFTVDDGRGGIDSEDITITVNNVNQLPIATVNPPTFIEKYDNDGTGSESVTLNGSLSSDPDGTITSYKWEETGAFAFSVSNSISTLTRDFVVGSSHTVTLTVTDNNGGVSPVSSPPATIIVNANALPTANAGVDQTVIDADGNGSESVTLNGSGSTDLNGGTITNYQWSENGSPIGSGASPTLSFTAAGSPHSVTLTVTDNGGLTDTDDVSITVNPSAPLPSSNWWDLFNNIWRIR